MPNQNNGYLYTLTHLSVGEYVSFAGAALALVLMTKTPNMPMPSIIQESRFEKQNAKVLRETMGRLTTIRDLSFYENELQKTEENINRLDQTIINSPEARAYQRSETKKGFFLGVSFGLLEISLMTALGFGSKRRNDEQKS
jgi:hypothetical protein